ncbi:hypothetical protein ACFQY0_01860 [Haloferula chungangensis]|uniref:Uncharacterized protein n=1 Tax=Haloferula chungangensis TaxID=1048331 RepID=A0ABW2L3K6_9BACT
MKLGPSVIGIIIAGVLGYLLEPSVRPALLPTPKKVVEKADGSSTPVEIESPAKPAAPAAPIAPAPPAWVATLTPEQLPEAVKLKSEASLPIAGASAPMLVPAGVQVKPVRVEGNELVINFGGTAEGKVAVMSTDLVQVLGNKPPEAPTAPPVAAAPAAPEAPAMADPATPAEPATPEAAAPAAPAVADKQLSPEEIVAVMQASVKAGEIKEFAFDQVLGWKADEDKESGGETYQTGLASYKAETIFGVKNIQAQALIKGGKVEKWIWPKSGMEIK